MVAPTPAPDPSPMSGRSPLPSLCYASQRPHDDMFDLCSCEQDGAKFAISMQQVLPPKKRHLHNHDAVSPNQQCWPVRDRELEGAHPGFHQSTATGRLLAHLQHVGRLKPPGANH